MSYNLVRDSKIRTLVYISYDFVGLKIKPKEHKRSNMINVSNMIITDGDLIKNYVKIRVDKRIKKLFSLVFVFLNDDGDSTGEVVNILGELNRLKSIINNKYKEFLEINEYDNLMKKIELVSIELKKRIVEIEMQKYSVSSNSIEGKSR